MEQRSTSRLRCMAPQCLNSMQSDHPAHPSSFCPCKAPKSPLSTRRVTPTKDPEEESAQRGSDHASPSGWIRVNLRRRSRAGAWGGESSERSSCQQLGAWGIHFAGVRAAVNVGRIFLEAVGVRFFPADRENMSVYLARAKRTISESAHPSLVRSASFADSGCSITTRSHSESARKR